MKEVFIYIVVDKVSKSLVQQFFAVSDEEAKRKINYSLEKEQIPSIMAGDLVLYRASEVNFPETFAEVSKCEQLVFNFGSHRIKVTDSIIERNE